MLGCGLDKLGLNKLGCGLNKLGLNKLGCGLNTLLRTGGVRWFE